MLTKSTIPTDERFVRWLTTQVQHLHRGSITLEVEDGKLVSISCHGHRFFYSLDELQETTDPSC